MYTMSSQVFGKDDVESNQFARALERLLRNPSCNFQSSVGHVDLLRFRLAKEKRDPEERILSGGEVAPNVGSGGNETT